MCGKGRGATYRFGLPGRIELTSDKLTSAYEMYSGGGETQIAFTNGDYTYVVFDRTRRMSVGRGNDTSFSNGLLIRRSGRTVSAARCRTDSPMSPGSVERALPKGPFVYHD